MSPTVRPAPDGVPSPTDHDRAVAALVRPLALAIERRRAYGGRHPVATTATAQLLDALRDPLRTLGETTLRVDRDELRGHGGAIAAPGSRELAARLHRRGVAALVFDAQLTPARLEAALDWLAGDAPPSDLPVEGPGCEIVPHRFGDLALADDAAGDAPAIAGARAALARLAGEAAGGAIAAESALAAAALLGAVAERAATSPARAAALGVQVHDLLRDLGAPAWVALVQALPALAARRRLLVALADALPPRHLARWLAITAAGCGRPDPVAARALIDALVAHVDDDTDAVAVARTVARGTVHTWCADDAPVVPWERLARLTAREPDAAAPLAHAAAEPDPALREAARLVQLGLATDRADGRVRAAADALVAGGAHGRLRDLLAAADASPAGDALRRTLADPDALRALLLAPVVREAIAAPTLDQFGADDAPLLIALLGEAPDRVARRLLVARLGALGPAIAPALVAALPGAPWFLARNLLVLLRDVGGEPTALDTATLLACLDAPEPQLRAEAVPLLLAIPGVRGAAIARAVRDPDAGVVRTLLVAMLDHADALRGTGDAPAMAAVLERLDALADAPARDEAMRATAVLALGALGGTAVRDRLIARLTTRSALLRRTTLVEPVPAAVAALHVLRRDWARDPVARPVLDLAAREARDPRWVALRVAHDHGTARA